MKKAIVILLLALLAAAPMFANGSSDSSDQLIISTWGLSEDDLWVEVFGPFEEENNVTVVLDVGNAQERYTKLMNDPNTTVDVIELAQKNTADGVLAGAFDPIQESEIDNFDLLIPAAQEIIRSGSGAPYTLSSIGIVYNKANAGIEINHWADLWDPALKGKIAIPDLTTTNGPGFLVMCSDVYGVDATTDGGETAFKALADLKPNVARTYTKSSDVGNFLKTGEIAVAIIADFGVPVATKADPDAIYVVPEEGSYANFNVINITKTCHNRDLAVKYINYRLDAATETRTAEVLNEAPVNTAVVLTPEVAANKTVGEVAAKAKVVDFNVINPLMADWLDRFNRLMNN